MVRKNKRSLEEKDLKEENLADNSSEKKVASKRKLTKKETKDLTNAIIKGNDEESKRLIDIMDDVNEPISGITLLSFSCQCGRIEIAKYLIELGGDVNILTSQNQYSLLMNAIQSRSLEIARILINAGVDINYINKLGESALSLTNVLNNFEIFELLISSGADVVDKEFALIFASKFGNVNIVEKMIGLKAEVNYADLYGWTPLHYACNYNNLEMVELLMNNGANNIKEKNGKIPIDLTTNETIKEFINNYDSSKFILK